MIVSRVTEPTKKRVTEPFKKRVIQPMKKIDSAANPFFKMCKSLLSNSGIKEAGKILVAGRKIVPEYLRQKDIRHVALIVADPSDVKELKFNQSLDVYWLKRDLFHELDEAGTKFPLLVIDAPPLPTADLRRPPEGLEVVLAMSNPLNLGAALRICDAFSVQKVILLKESAHPFLPKVIRSSSGSAIQLKIMTGPSVQKLTDAETKNMIALDLDGQPIQQFQWPKNSRLFIGEEGRGIPKNLEFQGRMTIPIKPGLDSLNAVSAVSIALYAARM